MCVGSQRIVRFGEVGSKEEKDTRTFETNAILRWLLEIPLVPIFKSLEPHSLFGCDPFVLLPLQPSVVFLFGLLAFSHTGTTASIVLTAFGRAGAGGVGVGVVMITFAGGGFSVSFVALTTIVATTAVSVVLGARKGPIPTTGGVGAGAGSRTGR